jgi:acetyl/propionyl-CoA carboxylase alpha subunit
MSTSLTLEAMNMETVLRAPAASMVTEIVASEKKASVQSEDCWSCWAERGLVAACGAVD